MASFATSYIPTVASQVTRAADSASMIGNNFARWYTQGPGTVYSEAASASSVANTSMIASHIDDGTNNNRIICAVGLGGEQFVIANGSTQAQLATGITAVNVFAKVAFAYSVNDFAASRNAGTVATDLAGILPVVSQLRIGSNAGGATTSGYVKRIAYYNRRLSNTELQGITS